MLMLSKIWYWGWRNLTTGTRAVNKPEDLAGMKIRVPESPVWVEMIRAMGGAPTPIPFGEVYTALQQKTVDGQENPIPTIYSRKFYEVQAHLSMTRHMLQNNTMIINKRSFDKLSPELQKVLLEEAAAASAKNSKLQQERETSMLEEIRKSGKTAIVDKPGPRRLRRQDGAGDAEARVALGCGAPAARARRRRRVQRQAVAPDPADTSGRLPRAPSAASTTRSARSRTCSSSSPTAGSPGWCCWRWCFAMSSTTRSPGARS